MGRFASPAKRGDFFVYVRLWVCNVLLRWPREGDAAAHWCLLQALPCRVAAKRLIVDCNPPFSSSSATPTFADIDCCDNWVILRALMKNIAWTTTTATNTLRG